MTYTGSCHCELPDAAATEALGARLAGACGDDGLVVYLHGELGSGKTTLVRGLLHALGHAGRVRSPTYTLVEPYELGARSVYHFDLYRLVDPEELEFMGIRDFLDPAALLLVEWPEKGAGWLPPAELDLSLAYADGGGRSARLAAAGARGEAVLARL